MGAAVGSDVLVQARDVMMRALKEGLCSEEVGQGASGGGGGVINFGTNCMLPDAETLGGPS